MNNPSIKCNCTYNNGTICHITKMYASNSLSLSNNRTSKENKY